GDHGPYCADRTRAPVHPSGTHTRFCAIARNLFSVPSRSNSDVFGSCRTGETPAHGPDARLSIWSNKAGRATAWATEARGGGLWAASGVATDGTAIFAATGNTFGASMWMGGEAILRLGPGATFSGLPADYFTPSHWPLLDTADSDLGASGPLVLDVPGATPS